jgi:hypothetical protein
MEKLIISIVQVLVGYGIVSGIIGEAKRHELDIHNDLDFDANTISLKLGYNY